jgi:translation initiation factor 1
MPSRIEAAGWRFDNSYARLPSGLFARSTPVPVKSPKIVVFNSPLAAALGLDAEALAELGRELKAACGSGGTVKDGVIEIQGEHRDRIVLRLQAAGMTVKRVGG